MLGADINSVSSEGDAPLILATYACCTVKGADPTILDLLACRGVEVNAQNSNGDSPLSIAALYGRPDLLSLLLQYGKLKFEICMTLVRVSITISILICREDTYIQLLFDSTIKIAHLYRC